jgi:hypothetical protein
VGTSCQDDAQCSGGLCTDFGSGKVCTSACTMGDAASCPTGSSCVVTGAGKSLCKPSGNPARGGAGGCSTVPIANRTGDGMLGWCLMLIAAALWRSRRLRLRG